MKYRTKTARKTAAIRKARTTKSPSSPLRQDPTRTVTLRRVFLGKIRRQFALLKSLVQSVIGRGDYLNLAPPTANASSLYSFGSSTTKLRGFQFWLKAQLESHIVGQTERQIWEEYVQEGYRKGAGRAFDDVKSQGKAKGKGRAKAGVQVSPPSRSTKYPENAAPMGYAVGSREEFLRSSFAQPVSVEKAQLLAARTFDELEAVTEDMSNRMSRTLVDGMVQGKNPVEVARDLSNDVDISRGRAERIARTEIIRAHAEGQLTALEQMGVESVGAQVEWATAGDSLVCPKCEGLEGKILSIDKARGMLPLHPNCRCCWLPYFDDVPDGVGGGKATADDSGGEDGDDSPGFAFEDTPIEPILASPPSKTKSRKAKTR